MQDRQWRKFPALLLFVKLNDFRGNSFASNLIIFMKTQKKPWFGKRWTKSLIAWLDNLLFNQSKNPNFTPADSIACINITIGLVVGAACVILSFFMNSKQLELVASYSLIGASILTSAWFLYKTLPHFEQIWMKIVRSIVIVVLNGAAALLGFYIGMIGAMIAAVILIIWGVLTLYTSDSKSKSNAKTSNGFYTRDGVYIDPSTAEAGQYYEDSEGNTWQNIGGTFRKSN